jgi:hypothetical protein
MSADPQRIARLCEELADGIGELPGIAPLLPPVLAAVRDGSPAGPALDALDAALLQAGVEGGLGGHHGRGVPALTGVRGHPYEEAWLCPAGRCSRAEVLAGDRADSPVCVVFGRALRRVRLPS